MKELIKFQNEFMTKYYGDDRMSNEIYAEIIKMIDTNKISCQNKQEQRA